MQHLSFHFRIQIYTNSLNFWIIILPKSQYPPIFSLIDIVHFFNAWPMNTQFSQRTHILDLQLLTDKIFPYFPKQMSSSLFHYYMNKSILPNIELYHSKFFKTKATLLILMSTIKFLVHNTALKSRFLKYSLIQINTLEGLSINHSKYPSWGCSLKELQK